MTSPKPITIVNAAPADASLTPQPFSVESLPGDALDVTAITGYSGAATQTLKHVSGVLTWVTDV